MYVIVRDDPRDGVVLCYAFIAKELGDAHAALKTYQMEYKSSSERQNPRIMELHALSFKPALIESIRITEVPSEEREG